ncbi:hypothetical protein LCGC14_1209630 [marine sediment metagenome]|uniref:Uncharacterized protein n=1 Tax=marine sediment metagenome TaxID=412755 RepID=A0A0F9M1W6_9ZZZZ
MRKKMYCPGEPIPSLGTVGALIECDKYIMMNDFSRGWQPKHPGVISSMTVHTIMGMIRTKRLRYAIKLNEGTGL